MSRKEADVESESGSATVQFLAYLPVLFVVGVALVAAILVIVHFLKLRK